MKKIKDNAGLIILAIAVLLGLTAFGFFIYALIAYGDKPITEVPFWAIWLLQRK